VVIKPRARGGARKGAGRPRFAKSQTKASYFSTRINQRTRDLLEAEARLHGESLAVTAERLLQSGLEEKAQRRNRGRPLRALCFLVEQLSRYVSSPYGGDPKHEWHLDPFVFAAFRAAILHMLDALRPPGEVVPPPVQSPLSLPDTPDDRGVECARHLLLSMQIRDFAERFDWHVEKSASTPELYASMTRDHYGLIDARRDLGLKGPMNWEEDSE
jgi:hypothetical protein